MKKFKTLHEQKLHLINNKNIVDENIIEKILYERPYASLINPYKKFFYTSVDNDIHTYNAEVSIADYYKLATFDDLVASELNYHIGVFERRIKGAFAFVISEKMNSIGDKTATSYIEVFSNLDKKIDDFMALGFNDYKITYDKGLKRTIKANEKTQEYRKNLLINIADINDGKKKKNNLFHKYIVGNKPIPFWLVVHTLSLGDLVSIYQMLGKDLKNRILTYINQSLGDPINKDTIFKFEQDLSIIKELRNIINHYEPLYEFIRSKPKSKIRLGINRIQVYSVKFMDLSIEDLLDNFPIFKNNDNNNIVEIYCEILELIKKRDDIISSDIYMP
ncbi:MAG: Abi family protein [Bacteroidaceae bacterium]|nr:Abi family protein [Bacteroidaceae bacterium]MEA5018526.1 Abi family protein [Erysipelotrichaceae bacterium]